MTEAQSRLEATSSTDQRPPISEDAPRSSYGQVPGEELPAIVYISILLSFVGLMAASWLLFDRSDEIDLDLLIGTVLFTAMLGLPILLCRMVSRQTGAHAKRSRAAPAAHVEIYTGRLSSGEAWLQILLIPLTMALAAVAIGLVSLMAS
jgi:predicted membrane-bound spermidine synthase